MSRSRTIAAGDAAVLAALHGECFPDDPWDEQAVHEVLAMPGAFGFLAVHVGLQKMPVVLTPAKKTPSNDASRSTSARYIRVRVSR